MSSNPVVRGNIASFKIPGYDLGGIPNSRAFITIKVDTNAGNQQMVTIKNDHGYEEYVAGKGEGAHIKSLAVRHPDKDTNWTVEMNHQPGMLTVVKPSKVKASSIWFGNNFSIRVTAEDGTDGDFDDAIVTVAYSLPLVNSQPQQSQQQSQQQQQPQQPQQQVKLPNSVSFEVGPNKSWTKDVKYINVRAEVNAAYRQNVSIQWRIGRQVDFKKVNGSGEGVELTRFNIPHDSTWTTYFNVEINHEVNKAIKPSKLKIVRQQAGRYANVYVNSDDSGNDGDFNDAIVSFRYEDPEYVAPKPEGKTITFEIPAGNKSYIEYRVDVNAGNKQHVKITGPDHTKEYSGEGENVTLAQERFPHPLSPSKWSVEIAPAVSYKVNNFQDGRTKFISIRSEDGADNDYNDTVVTFRYTQPLHVAQEHQQTQQTQQTSQKS